MHISIGLQPFLRLKMALFESIFQFRQTENPVSAPIVNMEVNFWSFFNVHVKKCTHSGYKVVFVSS
mgnify:CR=1 FL=1